MRGRQKKKGARRPGQATRRPGQGASRTKKKAARKKAARKKTAKKKTAKKTSRKSAGKKTSRKKSPARKKVRSRSRKTAKPKAPPSALRKIQPELERGLLRLLGRLGQKLDKLPRSTQLKLLEVETGGFAYTLNRLRPAPDDGLTERQKEIARQVAQGLSNKQIGEKLDISPATVAAHLRTIFTKLRVRTRTALAKHALAYYG